MSVAHSQLQDYLKDNPSLKFDILETRFIFNHDHWLLFTGYELLPIEFYFRDMREINDFLVNCVHDLIRP